MWSVPFDETDPVNTPRGYVVDPQARAAMADCVRLMKGAGLDLGATAGEARYVVRDGQQISLHGASHAIGLPAMLVVPFRSDEGFVEQVHSNSCMQTVTWNADGSPSTAALRSYVYSPDSDSPHHADQTWLYSAKECVPMRFTESDVTAGPLVMRALAE